MKQHMPKSVVNGPMDGPAIDDHADVEVRQPLGYKR
jgi:hypothetical protein